jgi:outer membrane protein insertion porin family
MVMRYWFLCSFLVVSATVLGAAHPDASHPTVTVSMSDDVVAIERACNQALMQPVTVRALRHESDLYIDANELAYLVDFCPGATFTSADLARACVYLNKKRKFSMIQIEIVPIEIGAIADGGAVDLVFHLQGAWTFNKVKFEGVMLGKDMYRHHYVMEPGERFDPVKHEHSLENIRAAFYKEGYVRARVYDYFDYDDCSRSVTVHVVFEPNERYLVDKVDLVAQVTFPEMQAEADALMKQLALLFVPRIERQYYDEEEINKQTAFLKDYMSKRGFFSVSVQLQRDVDHTHNTIALTFNVLFKQKRLLQFSGNTFFSDRDLYAHMSVFGTALSSIPIELLKEELEHLYMSKGFNQVAIDVIHQDNLYHFAITEGKRARLAAVTLQAVHAYSVEHLSQQFFAPLIEKEYDKQQLEDMVDNLVAMYQKNGYWDCACISTGMKTDQENNFIITLVLDEGQQRLLRSECIEGYPNIFQEKLLSDCVRACGMPFDRALISDHKKAIAQYFQTQGSSSTHITYQLHEDGCSVDLVWLVSADTAPIAFGKTVIIGTSTIPFALIRKELCCVEGQPWDIKAVEQTIANLRRIGIYEVMYMYPEALDATTNERAVMLKLVEDDPFEIRLRAGFQQISRDLTFRRGTTYKIGGSLLYKNPLHRGDFFSTDVDVTKYYRNVAFEYHWPWFFGKRVGTSLKGYMTNYIQPVKIGSKDPLYHASQRGLLLFFGRRFTQVNWGFNIGMEFMETSGLSVRLAQAIDFAPVLIDIKVPYFFFEPTVLLDYLDNPLNPTRGSLSVFSCKGMFPWKHHAAHFFKVMFEHSRFHQVRWGTVLGGRFRCGHIFQNDFSTIMPPERFYLGGENSLRAYDYDHVPPLGIFIDEDGKKQRVPHGGKTMVNLNIEVRQDLFNRLSGVIFQDFGVLIQKDFAEIKGDRLCAATGFGLRYHTPIGPLRFDMGFKWRKRFPSDLRYAWFITLGHAF